MLEEGYVHYANLIAEIDFHEKLAGLRYYRDMVDRVGYALGYTNHMNQFPVSLRILDLF